MAKFKVKTAELISDLQVKINDLKSQRETYWQDKQEYDRIMDELVQKATYKIYSQHVTSYNIYNNNMRMTVDLPLGLLEVKEIPVMPKEPSLYQIQQLEKQLAVFSRCTDEEISVSDNELRTIFGD